MRSFTVHGAVVGFESILLGIITNIGGFLFGYDTGQISGILIFRDFKQRFSQFPDAEASQQWNANYKGLLVSLMSIGSLLGALSNSYTADWWGRRKSLSFGVLMFIVGNIIQITAMQSWIHMMMGRFVAGIGIGTSALRPPFPPSR